MFKIIFIIFLVCIIVFLIKNKIRIKWKSFFKKGIHLKGGKYGIYCYCGKQGSTKTASVIRYLYEHRDEKIYSNLQSIDEENIPYIYINGLEELLSLRDEHDCIIFFDEIFTEITKHQKITSDVMDFLSQMRKRRIVLLTTCQEWRLLPLDFRLYVRYQVNCSCVSTPLGAVSIRKIIDGDNIKWSDEEQDFTGELIETTIWHLEKFICNLYDTYEQIGKFAKITKQSLFDSQKEKSDGLENVDTEFWGDLNSKEVLYEETSK